MLKMWIPRSFTGPKNFWGWGPELEFLTGAIEDSYRSRPIWTFNKLYKKRNKDQYHSPKTEIILLLFCILPLFLNLLGIVSKVMSKRN